LVWLGYWPPRRSAILIPVHHHPNDDPLPPRHVLWPPDPSDQVDLTPWSTEERFPPILLRSLGSACYRARRPVCRGTSAVRGSPPRATIQK
jgi:hypothetical protein